MTSLIKPVWIVSKTINQGTPLHIGTYKTKQEAENAALLAYTFHTERCPNDKVEMFINER